MTDLLIFGLVTVALLAVLLVALTVQFSKTLHRQSLNADRQHERMIGLLTSVQDRLMAVDFATFKNYSLAEAAEEGGWSPQTLPIPDDEAATQVFSSPQSLRETYLERQELRESLAMQDFAAEEREE